MQIDERKIAVFIDFENVAMGVRESRYGNFDIDLVLKRLVEKGKITVKRAYSDWHRYTEFKRAFHQAAIELIDVPQTRYSGKNSADIRMVVDALDLSYQRDHIDTFVLVSGDSDFSPLVSKLREYGRYVIGMGVKQSSSDLLINNCDEFIFYEDLVRPSTENTRLAPKLNGLPRKKAEALRLVVETFEALQREGKEVIYGSVIKQTLVRKRPSFNETYFGYPSFSRLLEDAAENKLLQLTKDQKSGGYIVNLSGDGAVTEAPSEVQAESTLSGDDSPPAAGKSSAPTRTRSSRGRRPSARTKAKGDTQPPVETTPTDTDPQTGATPGAVTETPEAPAESPSPGETASAEPSTEPSPPVKKKAARPRRRSAKSRSAASKEPAVKASGEAPPPEAVADPPTEAAAAPPEQPAESASATTASPEGEHPQKEPLPPGETASAEPSSEPPAPAEKKPARPRRRSAKSRVAGSRKAAAKVAEEAPPAEASAPSPEPSATSSSTTATAAAGEQASVEEASPAEAPAADAPLLSGAAAPTTESDSDGAAAPKKRRKTATPRKKTTRSKTTRRRKTPAPDTEPTLFSQIQDSTE